MKQNSRMMSILKGFRIFLIPLFIIAMVYQYFNIHLTGSYGGTVNDVSVRYDFKLDGTFNMYVANGGVLNERYWGKYKPSFSGGKVKITYVDAPPREYNLPQGTVPFEKHFDYIILDDYFLLLNPHFK